MKVYEINVDFDKYDTCRIDFDACRCKHNLENYEMLFNMDGTSQKKVWWPRIMVRYNDSPRLGDYISNLSSDVLILQKEAIDKLKPVMGNVEVLPLDCDFGDYWAINILSVLDCIDYEKSQYELLSDELENGRPRIMYFDKYVFKPESVKGYNLFKIIDLPKSAIFVNEEFVETVKQNKITGFKFDLVWEN